MQKSRNITIFILVIMFAYFLFSQFYLKTLGSIYTYIINPTVFIVLSVILKYAIVFPYKIDKHKKTIQHYVMVAISIYFLIYYLSGIVFTFGKNPYNTGIKTVFMNLYSIGLVVLCREFIRYRLINNSPKKDQKLLFIFIVLVFVMGDIVASPLQNNLNIYYIFKILFTILVPSIVKNVLYTYIHIYTKFYYSVLYEIILDLIQWISPVLPNIPWILSAVLDICVPVSLLMYCVYEIQTKDLKNIVKLKRPIKPKGIAPMIVITIVLVWFTMGIFPIKPVGIATGSMVPNLYIGDLVFIKKCTSNDVEIGDIIEYKAEDRNTVHRVIKKFQDGGIVYFVTKGDNNEDPDKTFDENALKGKVIGKIRYLAIPTVWITNIFKR